MQNLLTISDIQQAKSYAGIGSRETPKDVCDLMREFATVAARLKLMLRSGAAEGADSAFEGACMIADGQMQIFLPKPGWRGRFGDQYFDGPTPDAIDRASKFLAHWSRLSWMAQLLHARNFHQILGPNLDDPVDFVICYTPDGATEPSECRVGRTGGTATGIKVARAAGIPVLNLQRQDHAERLREIIAAA